MAATGNAGRAPDRCARSATIPGRPLYAPELPCARIRLELNRT
jgi:hypothetical protein